MSALGAVRPILVDEFAAFLRRCRPPTGWPSTIAVSNSGGPDSTCLLFLLKSALESEEIHKGVDPCNSRSLLSLAVDHGLQSSSGAMADAAAATAARLGVEHVTARIPWSDFPYPELPKRGIESAARLSRYHLLLEQLRARNVHILALGHHADDLQETALMRMDRNKRSRLANIAAIRPIRRWGMGLGLNGELGYAGMDGMDRWLIRPLLGVRKDRILATCEANGLDYVTDKTNFQPDLTSRNAYRQQLTEASGRPMEPITQPIRSVRDEAVAIRKILESGYTDVAQRLLDRALIASKTLDISVTRKLKHMGNTYKPPPSTFILPTGDLFKIPTKLHERLILRILRYVSPCPWGSPDAEAGRRSTSIRLILDALHQVDNKPRRAFVAGGWVQWTPVIVREDGKIARRDTKTEGKRERKAWLVERQPPFKFKGMYRSENLLVDLTKWVDKAGQILTPVGSQAAISPSWKWFPFKFRGGKDDAHKMADLHIDALAEDPVPDRPRAQVLWDNRFLLDFDIHATQQYLEEAGGAKIRIRFDPFRHCLPTLHFTDPDGKDREMLAMPEKRLDFVRAAFIRPIEQP